MPRYDYRCPQCGWHGELTLPMTHDKPVCFFCEAQMVQILHAPATKFKGEGWTAKSGSVQDRRQNAVTMEDD